ncbi:MAG: polymerase Rpb6 [Acidobacteriota bacterium]|jgi:DNA-directed RNA polymerase subunit omega|nr:polymerase Rpb6 [Acidobacteriota bacterium]
MKRTDQNTHNGFSHISNEEDWPGIDSRYRLIIVTALRAKQLVRGSLPRIEVDSQRRKNTSIALEEVKQGLVPFTITDGDEKDRIEDLQPAIGGSD